jgi:TRAP-type C4-dicarboxylate transport system permease small subunit
MLAAACKGLALAGGALFAGVTLMSAASIAGRLAGRPIQGDFELAQLACAVAIACCLPYCQLQRGHIIVDFFTVRTAQRTRGTLDALGALLLGLVMALVAWRTGAGAMAMKASNETSMIMGLPVWYAYALMTPAFALTTLVALHTAWRDWTSR